MRLKAFVCCAVLVTMATAGHAADATDWREFTASGANPLAEKAEWAQPASHLGTLLSTVCKNTDGKNTCPIDRFYIVLIATTRWQAIYGIDARKCLTITPDVVVSVGSGCQLGATRIENIPSLTIISIKETPALQVDWKRAFHDRPNRTLEFIAYVLPTIAGGIGLAQNEYHFWMAREDFGVPHLPVDVEVTLTTERPAGVGQTKPASVARTFEDYANSYLSFSVGAGIRSVNEVNFDLAKQTITAQDITKLKTYGLVNLHPRPIDPEHPGTWALPHVSLGIEISKDRLNYGLGVGMKVPYLKDTAIAVLALHAKPDIDPNAKGASNEANEKRTWKVVGMLQYRFPLAKAAK